MVVADSVHCPGLSYPYLSTHLMTLHIADHAHLLITARHALTHLSLCNLHILYVALYLYTPHDIESLVLHVQQTPSLS